MQFDAEYFFTGLAEIISEDGPAFAAAIILLGLSNILS